ncbi:hypothetical protein ACFSSA_09680 [Luteolibacter algae]|uniref:RcnB family protein n=1 Tax=Luteolibacter algae TaxID=454151 RepID=A0ABW5D880_9BACT
MKTPILLIALSLSAAADPGILEPITAQELAAKQRSSTSLSTLTPVSQDDAPVPRANSQSIIAQSEILSDGQYWTLVPKGAVLFIPEKQTQNVGARPVGTLLQWRDFLARNPAWVSTHETSFDQASGESPIPEEKIEYWKKQDRVIVAVHQGGPISVAR